MVLIQDRILKIDIYNFEMSYKTPEKSLKSNQIYSVPSLAPFLFVDCSYFHNLRIIHFLESILRNYLLSTVV